MHSKRSAVSLMHCVLVLSAGLGLSAVGARCQSPSSPSPAYTSAFSATIDKLVETTMLKLKIPSVTVAVVHNGSLLHSGAYGLEHIKPDVVTSASTVYLLDSLTKQFTATAIMLLVQDGKLNLDAPVKTYVSYAPPKWNSITLRHLLTHSSGLPRDPQWGYPTVRDQDEDPDRLLKRHILNQKLQSTPGAKEAYSNAGYAALGAILSKVSGVSYSQFLYERIFHPLGMTSTGLNYSGAIVKRGARGYDFDSTKKEWRLNIDANQPMAAGAIQSNLLDLVKWDAALNGNCILTEASKREMWQSYKLTSGKSADYGFGWVPAQANSQPVVWHNGGGWGFNTAFYRFLSPRLTVLVLSNLQVEDKGTDHASELAQQIALAYSPDLGVTASTRPANTSSASSEKAVPTGQTPTGKKRR